MSQKIPSVSELIGKASTPCLVIREGDRDAILQKVKGVEWAASAFGQLKAEAEAWMWKEVLIPDRGGQWLHWYACEVDGSRLVTESPTVHRCPMCGRVNSGEPWDSVPLTEVHHRLSRAVLTLGVYYALSGDLDAAKKAAEILISYAGVYPHYPLRDRYLKTNSVRAAKVTSGTLGESVWLIPICSGYDLIRDSGLFSPADHQGIREQLFRPAAKLILKHNLGTHNIQCWHNAAIGMAGLLLRDQELVAFATGKAAGIQYQIAEGVMGDGFWFEGSWGYHFHAMQPILAWAEALRNCGLDLYNGLFRMMFEAPFSALRPDDRLPEFHDNNGLSLVGTAPHYEIAFARYGDVRFAWPLVRSERLHLNALLFGIGELPKEIPEMVQSTHLNHSGFIHLRKGKGISKTYLALDYGPHGGGHGHPDKLAFILYGRGKVLAPDPGSIAYGIPLHQKWYKQTVSHNTLVVDGKSQAECTGHLDLLVNGVDFDLVSVSANGAYKGVKMFRTLLFMEDLVLIIDRLTGKRRHDFDWVYHNRGELRTDFRRQKRKNSLGDGGGYEMIEDLRRGQPSGPWRAIWRMGEMGVRLTMLGSRQSTEVFTGDGMDNTRAGGGVVGKARTPMVIVRRRSRHRTTFRSVLQMFSKRLVPEKLAAVEVDPPSRARGVMLRRGKRRLILIANYRSGRISWENLIFVGLALFADTTSNGIDRLVLAQGSQLIWENRSWRIDPVGSVQFDRKEKHMQLTNLGTKNIKVEVEGRTADLASGQRWIIPF